MAVDPRTGVDPRLRGAPGAVNAREGAGQQGGAVTLPQAGSPLMALLVKYFQRRNPAVVVNEGNIGEYYKGPSSIGYNIPGPGRNLFRMLALAGMANIPMPFSPISPTAASMSPGMRDMFDSQNKIRQLLGLQTVVPYVDKFAHMNMWQPPAPTAAPPLVPVNTLPEPAPAPAPVQTPAGPMYFPPQPTNPLFGSQDPRRRLFR